MTARQLAGLAVHLARQLAERDDRAGEGHRTDEDTQKDLDLQDGDLGRVLFPQLLAEAGQVGLLHAKPRLAHRP